MKHCVEPLRYPIGVDSVDLQFFVVREGDKKRRALAYTPTRAQAERIVKALDTGAIHAEIYCRIRQAMIANDELWFDQLIAALDATPRGTTASIDRAFLKVLGK